MFDLLCSNGPEWNRFVSLEIRCGSILLDTAKIVDEQEIPAQILRHQRDVLRNHPEYVEDSVLTPDDVLCIL
ncbi:type II toxin-antitoxin system RnlB family antitoxin, partial [Escherichia coli]|uniref:type II toxin-antitoxin system RnlB family antitoxin n=1 Tax=Escherichia coli TaxID=562 RepID=UPI00254A0752